MPRSHKQTRRMAVWLLGSALVAAAAAIGLATAIGPLLTDIAPPNVGDLALDLDRPAARENAYPVLSNLAERVAWPKEDQALRRALDGTEWDEDAVRAVLASNAAVLEAVNRASTLPFCVGPPVTSFDALLPHVLPWRSIGRLLVLQSRQALLDGDAAGALRACTVLLRYGRLVQNDASTLIEYLVGGAILELGYSQARALAASGRLTRAQITDLLGAASEARPSVRGLERALKGEYAMMGTALDRYAAGPVALQDVLGMADGASVLRWVPKRLARRLLHVNRTKLMVAENYRTVIAQAPHPLIRSRSTSSPPAEELSLALRDLLRPNPVGRALHDLLTPALDSLLARLALWRAHHTGTLLTIAANAYRLDHGAWPQDLQALTPAPLGAVPADPFDDQPFRYDPARLLVYAVGQNMVDDGGEMDADGKGPDVVMEIAGPSR